MVKLTKDEKEKVENLTDRVYKAVIEIVENGVSKAMNLYNKSGE